MLPNEWWDATENRYGSPLVAKDDDHHPPLMFMTSLGTNLLDWDAIPIAHQGRSKAGFSSRKFICYRTRGESLDVVEPITFGTEFDGPGSMQIRHCFPITLLHV